ncbi:hypothetical protein FOPE_00445 [Fonsecaea pedrosoi]|nr:hypothetical protein FOPE_00445 [Fonsecaea pedrosoi]
MSALLALSASHLAWQTKNTDTVNLAYHHRGVAIKGLHQAIGAFSRENSEAILAASILLSWQATDCYQARLGLTPTGSIDGSERDEDVDT